MSSSSRSAEFTCRHQERASALKRLAFFVDMKSLVDFSHEFLAESRMTDERLVKVSSYSRSRAWASYAIMLSRIVLHTRWRGR